MKIVIMQPYLFPYIGYFQLLHACDKFIIYDDVGYSKGSWVNRNNILIKNKKYLFSLPIEKASCNKDIRALYVSQNVALWKRKFLKTIFSAYKKAPYFDETYAFMDQCLQTDETHVSTIIYRSLINFCDMINLDCLIERTSAIYKNRDLQGEDRVVDICKKEGAHTYINAIGGRTIYSKERFQESNMALFFLKSKDVTYRQFSDHLIPNLSIIDALMFLGGKGVADVITEYELI